MLIIMEYYQMICSIENLANIYNMDLNFIITAMKRFQFGWVQTQILNKNVNEHCEKNIVIDFRLQMNWKGKHLDV